MKTRYSLVLAVVVLVAAAIVYAHTPGGNSHNTGPDNLLPVSKGVYRLPYPDGTDINVSNNHIRHTPHNRIDMSAVAANQNVVAAADGWIEYIVDTFDVNCPSDPNGTSLPCNGYSGPAGSCCVQQNAMCNSGCRNNYVFIRHPNGEWTKYTHMQLNTVPNSLSVGDFVTAGTVIGIEGDVGFASGPHVHFEVGVPDFVDTSLPSTDPNYDPLGINPGSCATCGFPNVADGDSDTVSDDDPWLLDTGANRQNRIPIFCQIGFLDPQTPYTAVACDGACNDDVTEVGGTVADDEIFYRQSSTSITSDVEVEMGAGAGLKATTQIRLTPGFSVTEGGFFVGAIGACDTPGT